MFFRKGTAENSGTTVKVVYEERFNLDLTVDEIHAWNCLIYSNPEQSRLREFYAGNTEVSVLQAHYAAWLIESKLYTGIPDAVADSLLKKVKKFF